MRPTRGARCVACGDITLWTGRGLPAFPPCRVCHERGVTLLTPPEVRGEVVLRRAVHFHGATLILAHASRGDG